MAEHSSTTESASGGVTQPENPSEMTDEQRMLLEFVGDRDVPCPRCGYNLRALTKTICPECREELALTVGRAKIRFGLFLVAVIPGTFSGICAFFLLIPIILESLYSGRQTAPVGIMLLDGFGWCSGLAALGLFIQRHRFLAQTESMQRQWIFIIWAIHLIAFAILVFIVAGL